MHTRRTHFLTALLAVTLGVPLATGVAGCRGCQRDPSRQPPAATAGAGPSVAPNDPAATQDTPTPETTDREGAPDHDRQQLSFRERSIYEMEQALGQPLRLRQDAVNAAYLRAGWTAGGDPTSEQDHRAYAQALAWGFDIRAFAHRGRAEPFKAEELADHPLEPPVVLAQDSAATELPMPSSDPSEHLDRAGAATKPDPSEAEIARIQRSLASLDQSVAQIEEQIAWTQQQLRAGGGGKSTSPRALRDLLLSLEQRLQRARSNASREQRAIDQLNAKAD